MSDDFVADIGEAAGEVWRYLDEHGEVTATRLARALGMPNRRVDQAVGWLAREEKLRFVKDKRSVLLVLR
jgi:hypothetical protein